MRQLEAILWVVRLGSFAGAASQLNATQSTISMRIQELEQELGVILFDRTRRKAHLTAKGRELLSYAEEAVALFSEIRRRVGSRNALTGVARLGVAELVAVTWLPELVSRLHREYPGLTLDLDVSLTANLFTRLREGDLDVVLIPGSRFESILAAHSLGFVRFLWMASPKLEIPDGPLTPRDLTKWPILSLGESSYHHYAAQQWLTAHGGRRSHVDVCNSIERDRIPYRRGPRGQSSAAMLLPSRNRRRTAQGARHNARDARRRIFSRIPPPSAKRDPGADRQGEPGGQYIPATQPASDRPVMHHNFGRSRNLMMIVEFQSFVGVNWSL